MPSEPTCSTCRYYYPITLATGYCKSAPPHVVEVTDPPHGHLEYPFPVVNSTDSWCGSWRSTP